MNTASIIREDAILDVERHLSSDGLKVILAGDSSTACH